MLLCGLQIIVVNVAYQLNCIKIPMASRNHTFGCVGGGLFRKDSLNWKESLCLGASVSNKLEF